MKKPEDFIGKHVFYDPEGQIIFGENKKGELQMLLNVRGWGAIQHLFETEDEAAKFHDELGEFISTAINEKLNKTGDVKKSLPDIYRGNLNTERIKEYHNLSESYNLEEGTIRDIFSKGAEWYKEVVEKYNGLCHMCNENEQKKDELCESCWGDVNA